MLWLEDALWTLYEELTAINPELVLNISPLSICPLPGTPLEEQIRAQGLLHFDDATLNGCFRTATADTHHMTYQQVSDWQVRLKKATNTKNVQIETATSSYSSEPLSA